MLRSSTVKITLSLFLFFNKLVLSEGFVAGTLVRTPNGYIPIEHLKENDEIISYNFEDATFVVDEIAKIKKDTTKKIVQLSIENQILEVDPEHRFYCPLLKNQWVRSKNLQENHFLLNKFVQLSRIDKITLVEKETDVYCLSIKENHNFFISEQDIFVHNFIIIEVGIIFGIPFVIDLTAAVSGLALCGIAKLIDWQYSRCDRYDDDFKWMHQYKGITNKDARAKAKEWGYKEDKNPPFNTHGQPAFKKGQTWISPDKDGHNGGVWKEFGRKGRTGTLDGNGNRIKG